jgi:hypothetical protein
MKTYSQRVFDLATDFMKNPEFVEVDYDEVARFSDMMKGTVQRRFKQSPTDDKILLCLSNLVASSINYCYWYGTSNIRPNGSSSSKMYSIVEECLKSEMHFSDFRSPRQQLKSSIDLIVSRLAEERFPLLEERQKHLYELLNGGYELSKYLVETHHDSVPAVNCAMEIIVQKFPGFASDMFLKRASLFFLMLHRMFGWYDDALREMHVPADYQVPKLLEFFGLIKYSDELQSRIEHNVQIPKHSQIECEIRAATILACKALCDTTEWNISDVDAWFWLRRKECTNKFHLTITTDY